MIERNDDDDSHRDGDEAVERCDADGGVSLDTFWARLDPIEA